MENKRIKPLEKFKENQNYWYVFDETNEDVYYFNSMQEAETYALQEKFTKYFVEKENRDS